MYHRNVIEEVLKHIPEDTTSIRHKDLMELCKKDGMAYETMRRALKHLEELGIIEKEAVKSERGAGTCYHRTIGLPSWEKDTERLKAQSNTAYALSEFTERGLFMERLHSEIDFLIRYGVFPEIHKYVDNPNREQAKARLNTVLKDIVTPWIIKRVDAAFPTSNS